MHNMLVLLTNEQRDCDRFYESRRETTLLLGELETGQQAEEMSISVYVCFRDFVNTCCIDDVVPLKSLYYSHSEHSCDQIST